MREEAEEVKQVLQEKYGEAIEYSFIDVQSDEMKGHPQIAAILDRVRLPLTCINGEAGFHGGFSQEMILNAVGKLLK